MEQPTPRDMNVVFIGRRNPFNMGIIRWLDESYTLTAVFFIEENRFSLSARIDKIRKRAKRRGALRVFDELLFQVFYRLWYGIRERYLWSKMMPEQFRTINTTDKPLYFCDDIHESSCLEKMRETNPDMIFSVCTHTLFKSELFSIPKFGMFMLHEGITPEYRGLHTPAWALLRGESEYIGYTLLRIDEGIDTGSILCQGVYPDADNFGFCWSFVGHSALVHGLPEMKNALDKLYLHGGEFHEVPQVGRNSRNYSWVALSDYLRLKIVHHTKV